MAKCKALTGSAVKGLNMSNVVTAFISGKSRQKTNDKNNSNNNSTPTCNKRYRWSNIRLKYSADADRKSKANYLSREVYGHSRYIIIMNVHWCEFSRHQQSGVLTVTQSTGKSILVYISWKVPIHRMNKIQLGIWPSHAYKLHLLSCSRIMTSLTDTRKLSAL